ncbi:hypothetical protein KBTX_01875 [wastewater metagenome]|uniref:Uncharacterized protein n=2 Tax=unclassified sequences TaxID=12908 RepID=A0A5B8RDM0_9ZZZZ|nr:DUF488 family protein [Arhodomonas aquaeolei]MCS4504339.1 DUF488 family protein [Arhodomonas aquaeolei]QEA05552.1 hypothetical protein KBTEX_01875 [uncultured organism]
MTAPDIRLKRAHDPVADDDGYRVLVDRVWPRGIRRADLALDEWARDLAPSTDLRRWFGHDPERWPGFRERYRAELGNAPEALRALVERCAAGRTTLVFSARDREHNQAVALAEVLAEEFAAWYAPDEPASPVCYAAQFERGGGPDTSSR